MYNKKLEKKDKYMGVNEKHGWRSLVGLALLSCLNVGSAMAADCVVGATDFDTENALFNPTLTNDEDGWYSGDLGDLLEDQCKSCDYYATVNNALQTGMESNTLSSNGGTGATWKTLSSSSSYTGGFAGITANPKVMSPYLGTGSGSNMFMAIGNSHESEFLKYSVYGLEAGSTATLTVDVYSLLDPTALEEQLTIMNSGVGKATDLTTTLSIANNITFNMQSSGIKLTAGSGQINGNKANVTVCTEVKYNQPSGTTASTNEMAWGSKTTLTVKATVDASGTATFYFFRNAGANFAPIGIDNLEVTGTVAPEITTAKKMPVCPANPVMLYLKQTYPEGTTYKWSVAGGTETSTSSTFSFVPEDINKTYKVSCAVTLPGCTTITASLDVTTKECCTGKDALGNDVPLAETSVFYDDFGTFPDNSTYEWTDQKGVTHQEPISGGLWTDVTRPYTCSIQTGVTTPDLQSLDDAGSNNPNAGWCITNVNPYTPGVNGDASGTGRGGMFVFDLSGSGHADEVVYERTIEGLCRGKEITFSTSFGAINNNPAGVGEMKIVLREESSTGKILFEQTSGVLFGSEGWQDAEYKFTMNSDVTTVVMQVVNVTDSYGNSQGDMAIDNVSFTVCTPPDVAVDAELSGNAKDLLDLCTDDLLTLKAEISDAAKQYYGNDLAYLFQYTYEDPSTTDESAITWYDLGTIQSTGNYEIKDPATHPAFAKIQDGTLLNVYFRVVIGKSDYLNDYRSVWESMSALSPCRAISISSIPIVAGLNCAACEKPVDPDITGISGTTVTKVGGMKTVNLCLGEIAHLSVENIEAIDPTVMGVADPTSPHKYIASWHRGSKTATGLPGIGYTDGDASTTYDVTYEDADVYYIKLVDMDFPGSDGASCYKWDSVKIVANPKPTESLTDPDAFCEGKLTTEPIKTVTGYTTLWYTASDTLTAATEPIVADVLAVDSPSSSWYVLEDATTGCRGDAQEYVITVNPIPDETLAAILPFCEGDLTATLPTSTKGYVVNWYSDLAGTNPAETNLSTLTGQTTDYTYYYTLTDATNPTNCTSDPIAYSFTVQPTATVTIAVTYDCDMTTVTATAVPATATVNWTIDGTTTATGASLSVDNVTYTAGSYSAIATATGYCDSKIATETVEFYATPVDISVSSDEYLKMDGTPDYSVLDTRALTAKDPDTEVTVFWSAVEGPTSTDESATKTAPTSGYSSVRSNPTPDLSTTDDEFFYYWIYQERKNANVTCKSTPTLVVVPVLGAPSPIVHDTVYCVNSTQVAEIAKNVEINQAKVGVNYELVWDGGVDGSTIPSTATPGIYTYSVAQQQVGTTNKSASRTFTVKILGVSTPDVSANTLTYCANDAATSVVATKVDDNTNYLYADAFVWSEDGVNVATAPTPNTAVTATTTYKYSVYQTYTIPTTNEVCAGDPVDFDVTVTFAPKLTTSQVTYIKADANASGSFDKNLIQQKSDVYTGETTGAIINWYASDGTTCSTPLASTPTPSVDASTPVGKDQDIYYCVSQTVDGCESETEIVHVVISDAPAPIVAPVAYCEGETPAQLTAVINELTNPASAYTLTWYDESHTKIGATAPTPSTSMRTGETTTSVYKYYVTQTFTATGAESTESELVVTVYANPVLTIVDPAAVCEKSVDLAPSVTLTNQVAGMTYTPSYFSDAAGTTPITSVVDQSGTYYVQYSYNATVASGNVCQSSVMPIVVVVDTLNVLAEDVNTCPDLSAVFTATAQTNATPVAYSWTGSGDASTLSSFTTKAFVGANYGDSFDYALKVTAGTCEYNGNYKVNIGEGPVVGTLTLADPTNTTTPSKVYTNSLTTETYYYCGGDVTVTPSYDGDKDYVITTPSNTKLSSAPFTVSEAGTYTIAFTNGCATKVTFSLTNAEVNVINTTSALEICENESFNSALTITPVNAVPYTVTWMKDGVAIAGETGETYSIASTKPTDSGLYMAEVNRQGCVAQTTAGQLLVKPYIQLVENKTPFIVPRGQSQTLPLNITVPASGVVTTIDWFDNGGTTSVNTGNSYNVTNVLADHTYKIELSDPAYCPTSTEMTIWVDAVLQLTTTLSDTMCYGMTYEMEIDTAGTGKFRQSGVIPSMTVIKKMNGTSTDESSKITAKSGKLYLPITAEKDASYTVSFTYGSQNESSLEDVIVIPAISVTLPSTPTICQGEETTLTVTDIIPNGTTITWSSDPTIIDGAATSSVTVQPTYSNGTNHQSTYTYRFDAYNATCNNKQSYQVYVKVDEPLKGEITGKTTICEFTSSVLSASTYDAATYSWSSNNIPFETNSTITVSPSATTLYKVDMTRGKCTASDDIEVVVTSTPTIVSMDSVGIRDRQVMTKAGSGTGTFYYTIDGNTSFQTTDDLFKNLTFATHTITVVDGVGCTSSFVFTLDPPSISIPEYMSPNGDGQNDNWVIKTLADVYPNAIVRIYDRFGKMMAEYLGAQTEGWDGTYNGVPMPSTDYWYTVEIEEIEKIYSGHFTLIRR